MAYYYAIPMVGPKEYNSLKEKEGEIVSEVMQDFSEELRERTKVSFKYAPEYSAVAIFIEKAGQMELADRAKLDQHDSGVVRGLQVNLEARLGLDKSSVDLSAVKDWR